jgi:hypothetical protein
MTMPHERAAAVLRARLFLQELASSTDGRIPVNVRHHAETLLRHYPDEGDMALTCMALPQWWQMPDCKSKRTR